MCFPVSSVVANIVMENVQTSALETFADPRFVEKICRRHFRNHKKIKVVRVFHLSEHNREFHPIHYIEQENEECFPFLHLLIRRSSSGHLMSAVYRKPIHLDRYHNFRSDHPTQQEQSVVNTLRTG